MAQSLKEHYGLLLGLEKPWEVSRVDLKVDLKVEQSQVKIEVQYQRTKVICPKCEHKGAIKDYAPSRTWRHLNTMNFETLIEARVPRCNCPDCGVKTASVPWAEPHGRFTLLFEAFAIEVLQASKSLDAGRKLLGLSWDSAHSIIKRAVQRGLESRDLSQVEYLGIDEKSFLKGHNYLTVLNDLEEGRVLDVVPERTEKSCLQLINQVLVTPYSRFKIEAVAMDMWPAFAKESNALLDRADIVFDRFHISKHLNEAVDQVRRAEHKQLLKEGDRSLVGTRYSWTRSAHTRTEKHETVLKELCGRNLKTSRAWALKESFVHFWESRNEAFAEGIFRDWYKWAIRCRLKPVVKVAKMLKKHLSGLMNYFEHRITNAVSEGLNSKIQSIKSSARDFRNFENYRIRILFSCGKLELRPKIAH